MGRILLFGIMAGLGLGLPAATGWYAGVETGSDWGTFRPYYTGGFPGETPAQYRNHGQGLEIGAVVGHEWQVAPPFSLGVQGRIATARAVWEVFFTESEVSFLKYQLGDAFALSVLPAVRLGSRLWHQGEAGWGMTHVREQKTSVNHSHYLYDKWTGGVLVGAGVRVALTGKIELAASYRLRRMNSFTYSSALADGSPCETITDKPLVHATTVGIRTRF